MALSAFSIRRPITTLMFYVAVVLVGIIGFRRLSMDFLPPVSIPRLTIHSMCADFSPEEMDERVAQPLAAAVGTVTGVERTSTFCRRGVAIITVDFSWGVDMDYAMLEARERMDQLGPELPAESGRPAILRIDPEAEPVMTIGVSSPGSLASPDSSNLAELTETCNALLKKRVEQVEGVAQVQVLGGVEREIRVELNETRLLAMRVTREEVAQALRLENASMSGGTIRSGALRYPMRLVSGILSAGEIARLAFTSSESGRRIRLSDVANVRETLRERTGWTRYNGREILVLQVRKEAGSSTLSVSANVKRTLEELERENPGLRLVLLNDQAAFIRSSVTDVEQSLLYGALLAFLVLFVFLEGTKAPLIVGVTMPVSILATLVAMCAMDISLNIISLTGLALGIGMLGDNAIIVIENVRRLHDAGLPRMEAILVASREINLAVTASTMTNVAVFLPVLFVRGVAQQLFADMALTMTVSLLASLVVAVTLVPVLLAWEPRTLHRMLPTGENAFRRYLSIFHLLAGLIEAHGAGWLDNILSRALSNRAWVLFTTLAIFVLSLGAGALISSEPAPEIDKKRFVVDLAMAAGMPASTLGEVACQIERMVAQVPGVCGVYSAAGIATNPDIWTLPEASHSCVHMEISVADSLPTASVMRQAAERMNSYCRNLDDVNLTVKPAATTFERILRPQSKDITIRIQGSDPAVNEHIAGEFMGDIEHLPGLADLRLSSRERAPEYRVLVDPVAAGRYGVRPSDVADYVSRQTGGTVATAFVGADQRVAVRVLPENGGRTTVQNLLASSLVSNNVEVPLGELIRCDRAFGCTEILRENGSRTTAITANVDGRSIGAVASSLREKAAAFVLPAGSTIDVGGENEEMESSFRSLGVVIVLSLVLVYMILAAEYESLLYPFVILLTSPLAVIGAVLAMLVTGEKYNVMSLVGMVIMIGAVDNDAVIAVDVITALRRRGAGLHEAIRTGMQQRLRPIIMTTATTVLGILPLMFSPADGSELVRALTIPLAGGLISSTLFTLVVIPVVYTYIDPWAANRM
jgi:hydrophobic/amphiphilic exporter-1 (mainly G- bacteria), HAE1 family